MGQVSAISRCVWDQRYRFSAPAIGVAEDSVEDTFSRVATALARDESNSVAVAEKFLAVMHDYRFLPAGRILAGAGTAHNVTLFNCFVMGTIPDDMSGIFTHLREAAITLQHGGGIGYDFSTLRPRHARVAGTGSEASGPLSFMDTWDAMCRTVMSGGCRRGAMMAALRCDHPDIEEFIRAKTTPGRLRMFNLSVLVTDAFMRALESDAGWPLGHRVPPHDRGAVDVVTRNGSPWFVWKVVKARDIWARLMGATYEVAEPGVIFIDRINQTNNLAYCETIFATNPCGEQPLPPYGACLLGSVNLAKLVERPFEPDAKLDETQLPSLVGTAVHMLDNVIDVARLPLPEQADEARSKRRIGIGITGLADALIMCGVRYGTPESLELAGRWMRAIQHAAYRASVQLAIDRGPFPLFDRDRFMASENVQRLDPEVRNAIARHGIRNAALTSIAPTGTISLLAENVTSGIEPVFSLTHHRNVLMPDGQVTRYELTNYAYRLYRHLHGDHAPLTPAFVDAQSLHPREHLAMQAALQRHVDSAISKTINVPDDFPFAEFESVYHQAFALGCKSCTTYRPNHVTGSILSTTAGRDQADAEVREVPFPALAANSQADRIETCVTCWN